MNLIEKYLGEDRKHTMKFNKLEKIIRKNLYPVNVFGYEEDSGFYASMKDKEQAEKLSKDMEKNFKIKTTIEKIGNYFVVKEKDKDLPFSTKLMIKKPMFEK